MDSTDPQSYRPPNPEDAPPQPYRPPARQKAIEPDRPAEQLGAAETYDPGLEPSGDSPPDPDAIARGDAPPPPPRPAPARLSSYERTGRVGPSFTGMLSLVGAVLCIASILVFALGAMQLIWQDRPPGSSMQLLLTGSVGFLAGLMTIAVVRAVR